MNAQDALRAAYANFDPEQPAPAPWRVARPKSPISEMQARLRSGLAPARYALVGGIGTGKSTELLRVADQRPSTMWVVLLRVDQQLDQLVDPGAIEEIQAWELVVLLGLALIRVGDEHGWADGPARRRFQEVVARLNASSGGDGEAEGDVTKLAKAVSIGVISAAGSALHPVANVAMAVLKPTVDFATLRWRIGRRKALEQDAGLDLLVDAVNALLAPFETQGHSVLVLLDGLDRIRQSQAAKRLFVDSSLLAQPRWSVVTTAPVVLLRDNRLGAVRGLDPRVLAEVPVSTRVDPWTLTPEGQHFFRELVARRWRELPVSLDPKALDRLAWLSGGRVRDFIHMVRDTIEAAWPGGATTLSMEHAERAIDLRRRLKEGGMHAGHVEVLRALRDDPDRRLPAPPERVDGRDFVTELLDAHNIVVLPNESEWYFPHPLLTLNVVPRPG